MRLINDMGTNTGSQGSIWHCLTSRLQIPASLFICSVYLCVALIKKPAVSMHVSFYVWPLMTLCHSQANYWISMSEENALSIQWNSSIPFCMIRCNNDTINSSSESDSFHYSNAGADISPCVAFVLFLLFTLSKRQNGGNVYTCDV